jgi:signal peptidase I
MRRALLLLCLLFSGCLNASFDAEAVRVARLYRERIDAHAGTLLATVHGTSMLPDIRPGDLLILTGADFNQIEKGDLIAFVPYGNPGLLVTHYVVARRWDGWITKGSNNREMDTNRVNEGNFVARASLVRLH